MKPRCAKCGTEDVVLFSETNPLDTLCTACCGKSDEGHDFDYNPYEQRRECNRCGEVLDDRDDA